MHNTGSSLEYRLSYTDLSHKSELSLANENVVGNSQFNTENNKGSQSICFKIFIQND